MLLHPAYHLLAAEYISDRLSENTILDVFINDNDRRWADLMICEGEIFTQHKAGFIRIFCEPTPSGRLKVKTAIGSLSPEAKKAIIEAIKEARAEY